MYTSQVSNFYSFISPLLTSL